jgi:hypothetical protein
MRGPFKFTARWATLTCAICFDLVERTGSTQKYCADANCTKAARAERDRRRRLNNPERHRESFRRWYAALRARALQQ